MKRWQLVGPNIHRFQDTCAVYAVVQGDQCVLIDFGSGEALQHLVELGVNTVTAVLVTHHHRDQVQGLAKAVRSSLPIYVPHTEQDLFHSVDQHWQQREVRNNYNGRQDRFSLLEPVAITGTLRDYSEHRWLGFQWRIMPTPGHTIGSISVMLTINDEHHVFAGDLFYEPGKLWSLSATQWTYNGGEGIALTAASLLQLRQANLTALYTGHGSCVDQPQKIIDDLLEDLRELLAFRRHNPRLFALAAQPYRPVSEHLLFNRTSMANSYVLLSRSGKALFLDYGYDFIGGIAAGSDRASRRPWLYTLAALKEQYGVTKVDVVIPTHYHDDHVAGFNLLRDVEGTEIWATQEIAHILEYPEHYDLPCLWYDPIAVNRVIPTNTVFSWEEYEIQVYPMSGHTRYSVAISVEVDGQHMVFMGDQYAGESLPNYVYANRFAADDFIHSALLLQELQPDWILTGHWEPRKVEPGYLKTLEQQSRRIAELHQRLLPLATMNLGMEGFAARITPYTIMVTPGASVPLQVEVRNPLAKTADAQITPVLPAGFSVDQPSKVLQLAPGQTAHVEFLLWAQPTATAWRVPLAVDVTVEDIKLGQQAEALLCTFRTRREGGMCCDRSGTQE